MLSGAKNLPRIGKSNHNGRAESLHRLRRSLSLKVNWPKAKRGRPGPFTREAQKAPLSKGAVSEADWGIQQRIDQLTGTPAPAGNTEQIGK